MDERRDDRASAEGRDDLSDDRWAVEPQGNKPTGRNLGHDHSLDIHCESDVTVDQLVDGVIVARLGHDPGCDPDRPELGFEKLSRDRDVRNHERLGTELLARDAPPTGQRVLGRGEDHEFFLAEGLDGAAGRRADLEETGDVERVRQELGEEGLRPVDMDVKIHTENWARKRGTARGRKRLRAKKVMPTAREPVV